MTHKTYTGFSTKKTPQSQSIPGSNQVANSAGGYSFAVDKWTHLNRFLILGSEGGTYYIKQQELTRKNADNVIKCIKEDGKRVVDTVVDVSDNGRAAKNDPALFVLAICAGLGDAFTRKYALDNLPKVARIGTHLFHFAKYVEQFRGWGRGLRNAIANWYIDMPTDKLAYQAVKYQQRDNWSHKDLLRLSHPFTKDADKDLIFNWITKGYDLKNEGSYTGGLEIIKAFEQIKTVTDVKQAIKLVQDYRLPMEAVPTHLRTSDLYAAMLPNLGMTAIIRNLGNYGKHGLLTHQSEETKFVIDKITNKEAIQKARVHPISVLAAMKIYGNGQGFKGSGNWTPVAKIIDALDDAFHLAFKNVKTTNKRIMLGLDVSGSMGCSVFGMPFLTAREASIAMAMVTMKTEQDYLVTGFTGGGGWSRSQTIKNLSVLNITNRDRLGTAVNKVARLDFGATDCALPMIYATEKNLNFDAFIIYTDNETWAGTIHPTQALEIYRQKTGIPAKLIVVGTASNGFTIADPADAGMLDVVGFDTSAPSVISEFIRGSF